MCKRQKTKKNSGSLKINIHEGHKKMKKYVKKINLLSQKKWILMMRQKNVVKFLN